MKGFIKKYRRPKRKNYQRIKLVEDLGCRVTQLECRNEILQGKIERLGHKNIQLRIINKKCNELFATFMCKCVTAEEYSEDVLNEIYSLSRKMLEEIK